MSAGDSVKAHDNIANNSSKVIQPGANAEWMLQNFYFGGSWELYRTDGTNAVLIDSGVKGGSLQNRRMIATNSIYYTIKNVSGGSAVMGFDGIVIK